MKNLIMFMAVVGIILPSSDKNENERKEHGGFEANEVIETVEIVEKEIKIETKVEEYYIDQDTVVMREYEEMQVEITAYCNEAYYHICNDGNFGKTAIGTDAVVGKTIAVDPSVIAYGTMVEINGRVYVAEDTGGAIKGNKIDLLFASHQEAYNFGRQKTTVKIYK